MKKFCIVLSFLICILSVVFPVCAREYADVTEETGIDFTRITDIFPAGMSFSDFFTSIRYIADSPSECIFSDSFNEPVPENYDPLTARTKDIYEYLIPNPEYDQDNPRSVKEFHYEYPFITCNNKNSKVYVAAKFDVYKTRLEYLHFEVFREEIWSKTDLRMNFRSIADYYREIANMTNSEKNDYFEFATFRKDGVLIEITAYYPMITRDAPMSLTVDFTY